MDSRQERSEQDEYNADHQQQQQLREPPSSSSSSGGSSGGVAIDFISDFQWRLNMQEQYEQNANGGDASAGVHHHHHHDQQDELVYDAGDGRLRYPVMFGGPPISFGIFGDGPNFVYVPRRADQRPGYRAPPMRATIKVENGLHLIKDSQKLLPVPCDDGDSRNYGDGGSGKSGSDEDHVPSSSSRQKRKKRKDQDERRRLIEHMAGGRSVDASKSSNRYVLQFEFDAKVACEVVVHLMTRERKSANGEQYVFVDHSNGVAQRATNGGIPVARFAPGLVHTYTSPVEHAIDFDIITKAGKSHLLSHDETSSGGLGRFDYPLVIEIRAANWGSAQHASSGASSTSSASRSSRNKRTTNEPRDTQFTYCSFSYDANGAGSSNHWIKVLKQKVVIDKMAYDLAEIYEYNAGTGEADGGSLRMDITGEGIGGGGVAGQGTDQGSEGEEEDNTCVVCMSETADVALLPCRHCCLCFSCSKAYVGHSDRCPICRASIAHGRIRIPRDDNGVIKETDSTGEIVASSVTPPM